MSLLRYPTDIQSVIIPYFDKECYYALLKIENIELLKSIYKFGCKARNVQYKLVCNQYKKDKTKEENIKSVIDLLKPSSENYTKYRSFFAAPDEFKEHLQTFTKHMQWDEIDISKFKKLSQKKYYEEISWQILGTYGITSLNNGGAKASRNEAELIQSLVVNRLIPSDKSEYSVIEDFHDSEDNMSASRIFISINPKINAIIGFFCYNQRFYG